MTSASNVDAPSATRKNNKRPHHSVWVALLITAFAAACAAGYWTDRVRRLPDPLVPVSGWRWWFTPIERNAFLRLPVIQGEIRDIYASAGSDIVLAVGERGLILRSDDSGRTWKRSSISSGPAVPQQSPPVSQNSDPVPSDLRGESWSLLPPAHAAQPTGAPEQNQRLVPVAPNKLRTDPEQAQKSAPEVPSDPKAEASEPSAADPLIGSEEPLDNVGPAVLDPYTVEQDEIRSLPPLDRSQQNLNAVIFIRPEIGLAVGDAATILRTADGGETWAPIEIPSRRKLNAVTVLPDGKVLIVGNVGFVAASTDQGLTWTIYRQRSQVDLRDVAFVDESTGVAVGDGIVRTQDGGTSWATAASTLGTINAVSFANARVGVAVGSTGTILRTDDGGEKWSPIDTGQEQALTAVRFIDADRAIAVGVQGTVLATTDAGRSWTARPSAGDVRYSALALARDGRVFSAALDGTISVSADVGVSWSLVGAGATPLLRRIDFADARNGIAVGRNGSVLTTRDGGSTWRTRNSGVTADLRAVDHADRSRAVAVGVGGTALLSTDNGITWLNQSMPGAFRLDDVHFADERRAFAVGPGLQVLRSDNGGETWSASGDQTSGLGAMRMPPEATASIGFADASRGIAAWLGLSLETADGGTTWLRGRGPDSAWTESFTMRAGTSRFMAVATVLRDVRSRGLAISKDGGASWLPVAIVDQSGWEHATSGAFADDRNGVIVGRNGTILHTDNGGASWTTADAGTRLNLNDVAFADANRAVALSSSRMYISDDAGRSWSSVAYRRYPSPWLWLAGVWLLAAVGVITRLRLSVAETGDAPASVADAAVSDDPIGWKDPDALGLRDIALAMSRFLRNRRTQPPLTLAVEGEWGTGKSSLMNLLRQDLRRYGFRPVWFNAWHHQSGENLLGSLLANIHAQGVPPWHTLAGIDFRFTLLTVRAQRYWLRLALTLFIIVLGLSSYEVLGESATALWNKLGSGEPLKDLGAATGLLGLIAAVLAPVVAAVRAVSAFGLQPAKLIAAVASTRHDESAKQEAGARYRFAREFADFSSALDPRTLVIFIDDLDRCRPKNVIDVLEAVNFLVTSGRCVVVLGMARRWVEACVEEAFKELAPSQTAWDRLAPRGERASARDVPREAVEPHPENRQFARDYLEKLINIEIRIPRLSDNASRAILDSSSQAFEPPSWRNSLGGALLRAAPLTALLVVGAGIFALGNYTAGRLKLAVPASTSTVPGDFAAPAADTGATGKTPAVTTPRETKDAQGPPVPAGEVAFENTQAHVRAAYYLGTGMPVLLAIAGLVALILLARREVRTDDSADFRDALKIFQPWIVLGGESPRSLKRFVNHLRYVAMRFRAEAEQPSAWERLCSRVAVLFDRREPVRTPLTDNVTQLEEHLLVALAAIYRCDERWLDELPPFHPDAIEELLVRDYDKRVPFKVRRRLALRLEKSIIDFNERFEATPLFVNQMLDRRYIVAFYEVMAAQSGAKEDTAESGDAPPPPPTQLRPSPTPAA